MIEEAAAAIRDGKLVAFPTETIPDLVTAGLPNVALRAPSYRVARALMEMAGVPIARYVNAVSVCVPTSSVCSGAFTAARSIQ